MIKHLAFLILAAGSLCAAPIPYSIEVDGGYLNYYVESPSEKDLYPLVLAIEGSYEEERGPQSVLRLHNKLSIPLLESKIGMITMERRGFNGDQTDNTLFHRYNTPSQRLADHIQLVQHLRAHPPKNWNGKLIILGGSEGGPITVKLSHAVNPSACIVCVGCGDESFKEYIWKVTQVIRAQSEAMEDSEGKLKDLPATRADYEAHVTMMKANPDPLRFWFGQSFRYWADALDQTCDREFLELKCHLLVITGSEDIEAPSTDRLIAKARKNNQKLTYHKIEGMGHDALDPQWKVTDRIIEFLVSSEVQR